eukprot:COSAG02_NODE_173_length_31245_cov_413.548096_4_plen_59_part_00
MPVISVTLWRVGPHATHCRNGFARVNITIACFMVLSFAPQPETMLELTFGSDFLAWGA